MTDITACNVNWTYFLMSARDERVPSASAVPGVRMMMIAEAFPGGVLEASGAAADALRLLLRGAAAPMQTSCAVLIGVWSGIS